jgi:hypothetical protein
VQPLRLQAAGEEHLVGPGQAQVAEQDRRAGAEALPVAAPAGRAVQGAEPAVRRRPPTPGVAAVHHVVVDDRAGLEELQGRRRGHHPVVVGHPGPAPAPVSEGRPQPLPATQQLARRADQLARLVPDRAEPGVLAVEEPLQRAGDPVAQVFPLQCHARLECRYGPVLRRGHDRSRVSGGHGSSCASIGQDRGFRLL